MNEDLFKAMDRNLIDSINQDIYFLKEMQQMLDTGDLDHLEVMISYWTSELEKIAET